MHLLEPQSEDSAIGKFLARRGEGLHHICFEVDDIEARMRDGDSVIFLAEVEEDRTPVAAGFTQLYPKWSSTTMHRSRRWMIFTRRSAK